MWKITYVYGKPTRHPAKHGERAGYAHLSNVHLRQLIPFVTTDVSLPYLFVFIHQADIGLFNRQDNNSNQ